MTVTHTPFNRTVEEHNPADLTLHPLRKTIPAAPEWANDGEEFIAFLADVQARGIVIAILIDAQSRILDGEVRWRAAKRLQIDVPAVTVEDGDAALIIVQALLRRKHLTVGARAYLAYPLFESAFKESSQRRLQNLRKGQYSPESTLSVLSGKRVEDFAERLGISRVLFFQAKRLHEIFAERPDLRPLLEPKLLSGENGLGATIAGVGGKDKGGPHKGDQLELFTDAFETLRVRFTYWQKFDDTIKAKARLAIRQAVAEMPTDLRTEFARALKEAKASKLTQPEV